LLGDTQLGSREKEQKQKKPDYKNKKVDGKQKEYEKIDDNLVKNKKIRMKRYKYLLLGYQKPCSLQKFKKEKW
jgi:hypothetical protein